MADEKLKNLRDAVLKGKDPLERLAAAKELQERGAGDLFQDEDAPEDSDQRARLIALEIKKLLAAD